MHVELLLGVVEVVVVVETQEAELLLGFCGCGGRDDSRVRGDCFPCVVLLFFIRWTSFLSLGSSPSHSSSNALSPFISLSFSPVLFSEFR